MIDGSTPVTLQLVAIIAICVGSIFSVWLILMAQTERRVHPIEKLMKETADRLAKSELEQTKSYVTRAEMKELRTEIIGGIAELKTDFRDAVGHLGDRIEAVAADRPAPAPRRAVRRPG